MSIYYTDFWDKAQTLRTGAASAPVMMEYRTTSKALAVGDVIVFCAGMSMHRLLDWQFACEKLDQGNAMAVSFGVLTVDRSDLAAGPNDVFFIDSAIARTGGYMRAQDGKHLLRPPHGYSYGMKVTAAPATPVVDARIIATFNWIPA